MSYQVLARKWRPRSFSELVGQQHVVRALVNALDGARVHHAFLFTGTRGVGKTTIARILAKCLNCEVGVSSNPCGQCAACREIDEGRFVDLIEVDAASRAKVDETRELMENVQFSPARGRYKVYLIDEVHMFSTHSFNALLKTLEEPPPHVKFLLATTDPQKLPVTVLSRCLQFNLRRLSSDDIATQLERILESEGQTGESRGLRLLARAADGSMRDALSLLDQAIAYSGTELTAMDVQTMLGTLDRNYANTLLIALADGDAKAVMGCVEQMANVVTDFTEALGMLISELQRVAVVQLVPESLDSFDEDAEAIRLLAERMTPEDVQLYYQIGLLGRRDLPLAPDPRGGFEMVLLRMLAFRPDAMDNTSGQPTTGERETRLPIAATSRVPALGHEAGATPSGGEVTESWAAIVKELKLVGISRELAVNSVLEEKTQQRVRLRISPAHAQLAGQRVQDKLQAALCEYYRTSIRLEIEIATSERETPATLQRRHLKARQQAAADAIEADPNVEVLCKVFDARIEKDSIQSVER